MKCRVGRARARARESRSHTYQDRRFLVAHVRLALQLVCLSDCADVKRRVMLLLLPSLLMSSSPVETEPDPAPTIEEKEGPRSEIPGVGWSTLMKTLESIGRHQSQRERSAAISQTRRHATKGADK